MARNGWADGNYLTHASAALGTTHRPMSFSCWIKPSTNTDTVASYTHWLWQNEATVNAATSPKLGISIKSSGTVVNLFSKNASPENTSSSSYTASTDWYHVGVSWETDDTVTFYKDGSSLSSGSQPLGTGTEAGGSVIGALRAANIIAQCAIAELGVWGVVLTAAEFASLGRGLSPALIRPASLRSYPDLIRGNVDRKGGALTTTGTVGVADHPRIIYPRRARSHVTNGAAPAASTIGLLRANAGLRWGPFSLANAGVGAI